MAVSPDELGYVRRGLFYGVFLQVGETDVDSFMDQEFQKTEVSKSRMEGKFLKPVATGSPSLWIISPVDPVPFAAELACLRSLFSFHSIAYPKVAVIPGFNRRRETSY
jgi:hypothetical protein